MRRLTPALFFVASVTATVADIAVFQAMIEAGAAPVLANVCSFTLGTLVAFVINRRLTFAHRASNRWHGRLLAFAGVSASSLLISTVVVAAFEGLLTPLGAKIVSLPMTFVWSYTVSSRWVFRETPSSSG